MKLKDTLSLPRTDFPMKAALPTREPERLERWQAENLVGALAAARAGRTRFILHDGPPYANGHLHLGTALNKILKDFVLKARSQAGFDVPYVPGWDCHGMPIEHQVVRAAREAGESLTLQEVRQRCREFAERFVDVQRQEFQRLGILGHWQDPYLTMHASFEAAIVRAFGRLHELGYITKGQRSIHWCTTCRTALANAEVEHDPEHRSTAVHVRFEVPLQGRAAELGLPAGTAVLAWTTTPWTLPANVALAVRSDLDYVLVGGDGRNALVARALLDSVAAAAGWTARPVLGSWSGRELDGVVARNPLIDRDSPVVLADHVTTDAGTGVVHTAPGHGVEDFELGVRLGLPILVPVDRGGVFTAEAGPYAGRHVFAANSDIVKDLAERGALVKQAPVTHSYPTCWRCHEPLIFLATDQWFLRVEHAGLRDACLAEVEATRWVPGWGRDRMRDAVTTRPDWCLSRQRAWGVPIPAFACRGCQSPVLDTAIVAAVEQLIAAEGSDAWFAKDAVDILPPGTTCPACGGTDLEKDPNILDVWFDASCSHDAVLENPRWPELTWPADLYLEAVDQHRGWFQVSLLNAVALRGQAPYRAVLTHGLILDGSGRKMSKSLGNVVSPDEIIAKHGVDVLRLLYASVDATADIRFSPALLDPVSEAYRKIRNTLRFLLGNLQDFNPESDCVPEEQLLPLDRLALERLREVSAEARSAYDALQFNRVYRTLLLYLTTDVSAFYAHALKERLYAEAPAGLPRRSAQTVLMTMARECCQLLAPLACFTADEVWEHLPAWAGKLTSVHLATWPEYPPVDRARLEAWEPLLTLRPGVLKALEVERAAGRIGDSMAAEIEVQASGELRRRLLEQQASLAELFVVSGVQLAPEGVAAPQGAHVDPRSPEVWTLVRPARGRKCPRCWAHREDGGRLAGHPDVCARCARVVADMGVAVEPA